jgi:tetratricopeptide (TPR) repeat protein
VLAHYNLAVIYANSNRKEQALTEVRRAVEEDPQFIQGYVLLGQLSYEAGDFESAIQNLTRATELTPGMKELQELHVLLGNAYLQSGREDGLPSAEKEFRTAVEIDTTYVDGLYSLGMSIASQGREDEAVQWFRKARPLAEGRPEFVALLRQLDAFTQRTGLSTTGADTSNASSAQG